ncbi:helix-turn-helix transcriptional regulator [Paenochrobactrum pullorum]|uniref:helix-turn-helix transcriptional regulator n=1 Tax=Paenochrobactrum pullorum TaxID=1324351 RepID=UPI0035BC4FA4
MKKNLLPRQLLRKRIIQDTAAVVFLRAPSGAGKSVLLEFLAEDFGVNICCSAQINKKYIQQNKILWDVPINLIEAEILPDLIADNMQLYIACRPDQHIRGLARHGLHHGVTVYGGEHFSFKSSELTALAPKQRQMVMQEFAQWPSFLPLAKKMDERNCIAYLDEVFLAQFHPAEIIELSIWLDNPKQQGRARWHSLLPPSLIKNLDKNHLLRHLLKQAVKEKLEGYRKDENLFEIAKALEKAGQPLEAMRLLLDENHEHNAAQILKRAQGRELIYESDLESFQDIIMRFSTQMLSDDETVLFAVARTLLKQGELQRVRHLLMRHMGADYIDPLKVLTRKSRFSFAAKTFRLTLMISEDLTPSDTMISRLGEFMADYPMRAYGRWAGYYNSIIEFEVRRRNFREAEAAAARALMYLKRSGDRPLLDFFIHLHQIVLRLMNGDVLLACQAAIEARSRLEQVSHPAVQEFRMLRLAEACLDYEAGQPGDLLAFVNNEFEAFAAAEIWPSLMQFALHYASQILADNFPVAIRPGFLDHLWIHLSEGLQFNAMMEIRTAIAYQNANRWQDAALTLAAVRMPMGRTGVESAIDELSRISRRDEISFAMAWLRDAVHQWTPRSYLPKQLDALLVNPKVTNREKVALQLWLSFAAFRRGEIAEARAGLLSTLQTTKRLGCYGVLSEERIFLSPLLKEKRIRSFIETSPEAQTALTVLTKAIDSPQARAIQGGLSQREIQMLQLLCSGMSNKRIAHTLSISEVTVKFHLSNLYRKMGCRKRSEALKSALALGWI